MSENVQPALGEVLESFMTSVAHPDRASLERYVSDYPHYANELSEFAAEWILLDAVPAGAIHPVGVDEKVMAMSVMERLRHKLRKVEAGHDHLPNPFEGKSATWLKATAVRLGLDTSLMAKLKNRLILVETVPDRLMTALAEELGVALATVRTWLSAPPRLLAASFKTDDKPQASRQESFAEAVERSALDESGKRAWLGK